VAPSAAECGKLALSLPVIQMPEKVIERSSAGHSEVTINSKRGQNEDISRQVKKRSLMVLFRELYCAERVINR
jgi:hypothetical protein